MLQFIKKNTTIVLLFLSVFTLYLANLPIDYSKDLKNGLYRRLLTSNDMVPNTFLPYVVIIDKTVNFKSISKVVNRFDEPAHKENAYYLIPHDEGYISAYPILTGLMGVPVYAIPLLLRKIPELTYHENIVKVLALGRVSAAFYTSLSVVIFFIICNKLSGKKSRSIIFSLFYAFGTGMYTTSSRGMWMHTISTFLLSLLIFVLLITKESSKKYVFLGLLSGLLVLNRPTGIVFSLLTLLYVLADKRKYFLHFLLGVLPMALLYLGYNKYFFGGFFTEGYSARGAANEWTGDLLESIPAYFISPARGFLFLSPPLLLGFVEMYRKIKSGDKLYKYLAWGVILSMLMLGKWYTWHGANAFGNRMLVDYLPVIGLFSFLGFIRLKLKGKYFYIAVFLMVYSIFIHTNAVLNRKSRCDLQDNWNFNCLRLPKAKAQY